MSKNGSSTVKDLTAGTVGGIAQVLVGQPFDIVKVVRLLSLALAVTRSSFSFYFTFLYLAERAPVLTRFLPLLPNAIGQLSTKTKNKKKPRPPGKPNLLY